MPEPQTNVAQVVPGFWEIPPKTSQSPGDKSWQVVSEKQQAAGATEQLTGVYAERITQSPLGVQMEGNCWNVIQPAPQIHHGPSIASIQFSFGK